MRGLFALLGVLALVAAFGAAACGGSDEEKSNTTGAVSLEQDDFYFQPTNLTGEVGKPLQDALRHECAHANAPPQIPLKAGHGRFCRRLGRRDARPALPLRTLPRLPLCAAGLAPGGGHPLLVGAQHTAIRLTPSASPNPTRTPNC